jgi:hypothetical protein
MPAFLDRFGTKPSKHQNPSNTNLRVSSRPISPTASPPQPKVALPRERTISNVGNGSSGSIPPAPHFILTQDDSSSPISVTTPGSLHRADSALGLPRKKSASQLSTSSKSQQQRVATMPAGFGSLDSDLPTLTQQRPDTGQTLDPNANGSRSRKTSVVTTPPTSLLGHGQLNESPTEPNGSRRSGSVSSTEGQTLAYLPLQLVESPKSDGQGSAHARNRSTSAVSGKESGQALTVNNQQEVKKRKSWRRPSATESTPQFAPFQLHTAPTIMSKKPQTRHQSTMGMGLASALAASGLGVVPPSHVMALSPTPGQGVNVPIRKQTSAMSLGQSVSTASLIAARNKRNATGRTRGVSSASSSTAQPVDGTEGSGSDDSDYDSGDALDFGDDDIPITGFAVATMKRNQEFHDLFPTIPVDDYLIDGGSFAC